MNGVSLEGLGRPVVVRTADSKLCSVLVRPPVRKIPDRITRRLFQAPHSQSESRSAGLPSLNGFLPYLLFELIYY